MTVPASRAETPEHQPDPRSPEARIARLVDGGTAVLLRPKDSSGVVAARSRVDGARVIVFCTDATRMGGAMGAEGCRHIVEAIDTAVRERCPVIGLWHCDGVRLAEGIESLDGVGQMCAAMVRASGRVPQISLVLGPAAGGAAYGPALTDVVVLAPEGRVVVTGPDVVRGAADDENDAFARTRRITGLFAKPGLFDLHSVRAERDLRVLLPEQRQRAYDVRQLIRGILDAGSGGTAEFEELQATVAPNMVIGLGRLGRRTVGVVANNPQRLGGCLDSASAQKASRFVRMCDAFGIPLLVLADVPGYLPGVGQDWDGAVRRGTKLVHAFAEAIVPRVTLVTRKSYGDAYIAMNARCLGATAVFAWPGADVAVMGAKAAAGILHRSELAAASDAERDALHEELATEHERISGGLHRAVELGLVDEIIEPTQTRRRLAEALAAAPAGRGAHSNIPL